MNMDMTMDSGNGGFLNDTQSVSSEKNVKRIQNIIPVMIKQILKSTDNSEISDISTHMLTIVGILRSVNPSSTKISYEIQDDTGKITCIHWLEGNQEIPEISRLINTYFRVVGLLREQQEIKQIFILRILPIEDLNALTNHLLEVIYVKMKTNQLNKTNDDASKPNETTNMVNDYAGMSPEQTTIFNIIQSDTSDNGIEKSEVKTRTPPHILRDVDTIIQFLISEGHIYTTCTDDHFKAT